ncbi:MAG: tetratricopeptide repeat protein, partial [Verrucomicrobiota bacterium]
EIALRLAGYGYPTSFFLPQRINGNAMLVENDRFGFRFFPPALARSPAPTVMRQEKPPGVYRIFLFGESAAMGDPRPAYGVGRYLETLLRERFPDRQFEVVCVAMTAINSHAILPIARECARYQGDLWIVYMGNNEMAGPFGANTVLGLQAPHAATVRAILALQRTRTGQLLASLARRSSGRAEKNAEWGGLKMFLEHQLPPTDPRKERVYDNFRRNLEDIVRAGVRAGVPIVLSSVASNLKDCAPFASQHSPALGPADQASWDKVWQIGTNVANQGRPAEAIKPFQEAIKLSPEFAEVHFRIGQCFLSNTNDDAARTSFEQARDLDTLPFRTDSRLNAVIANVANRFSGKGVRHVEAEEALSRQSTDRIPGTESFYEHVHLTFAGNYWLARSFAEQAATCLPTDAGGHKRGDWATQELCEQRLGMTDWNRYSVFEEILRRVLEAPFTHQLNHPARVQQIGRELARIKDRLHPRAIMEARFTYEEALKKRPQDYWLRQNFAEFLEATGELSLAAAEWEKVRDLLPHHHVAYYQVGRLLAAQKRYAEARKSIESALRLRPDLDEAYLELGQIAAAEGKVEDALKHYAEARLRRPNDPRVFLRRADILAGQGKRKEAMESLREAIRLRPSLYEAHYLLGVELAVDEKIPEAQGEFEEVIRLRPEHALAHLNLGVALARQRRFDDALLHFNATLRLDPQNQKARQMVETLEQWRKPGAPEPQPKQAP